jgi:hypothetical protein
MKHALDPVGLCSPTTGLTTEEFAKAVLAGLLAAPRSDLLRSTDYRSSDQHWAKLSRTADSAT